MIRAKTLLKIVIYRYSMIFLIDLNTTHQLYDAKTGLSFFFLLRFMLINV